MTQCDNKLGYLKFQNLKKQNLDIYYRLSDLCSVLDCSMAQIFRFAAHLIYWRKAKIIDVINNQNIYVVSPAADMNS
jgi:hypothetical protein